jgi:tRNA pseudouridine65 synthase
VSEPPPLPILYRDEQVVAVHKPSGLFVHPTRLASGESSCLGLLARQVEGPLHPVHRLDRATSGVLVFALSPEAARRLGELFQARQVQKSYLAVVRGWTAQQGRVVRPLSEAGKHEPKEAVTDYRREATVELPYPAGRYERSRYSLLRVLPRTGRRHQIRRHLAHIAHPVVGDTTYGDGAHNRLFRRLFDVQRLLLMAMELSFTHPFTGAALSITAPLPADVQELFLELGWEYPPARSPQEDRRGT